MNCCYYCEEPVDRLPKDDSQHICERCRKSLQQEFWSKPAQPVTVADYWTKPPAQQAKVRAKARRQK